MRTPIGRPLAILAVAAFGLVAQAASAQVSTERPGSILIFPKVINSSSTDTVIQVTNTSNQTVYAHCFYVNGATVGGRPLWQITDFDLALTRQQPTQWTVSAGRSVNPLDGNAGLDPGSIPPVASGFTGQLVCAQVDASGVPLAADAFVGHATVGSTSGDAPGEISKYNGITIEGLSADNGPLTSDELRLDNVEYGACPAGLHLNFVAQGATDEALVNLGNGPAQTNTALTFVPCDMDFESLIPGAVSLNFEVRNEFEQRTSVGPLDVNCWETINLDDPQLAGANGPLTAAGLGTTYGYALITPSSGNGVLGVANTFRVAPSGTSTAAYNLHVFGNTRDTNLSTPGATIRVSPH